jgi:chromosomal replication initiation ATPase DnaA
MTYLECTSAAEVIERARAVERRKQEWSKQPRRLTAYELAAMESIRKKSLAQSERKKATDEAALARLNEAMAKVKAAIEEDRMRVMAETIIQATCIVAKLSKPELCSDRRHKHLVRPRHAAMDLMRRMTSMSFVEIGRRLGGRDHSTVHHGCKMVEANPDAFAPILAAIEAEVVRLMAEQGDAANP